MEIAWSYSTMAFPKVFLLVNLLGLTSAAPGFSQQPEQRSALAGGDVTFYCVVENLIQGRHSVQWSRGGSYLTNNADVLLPGSNPDSTRITVVADPSKGQYNLQISDVGISDDLTYFCRVYDQNRDQEVLRSAPVRLEVHNLPSGNYPQCNPLEKPFYYEGTQIEISCTSERANPPVLLQWYKGGRAIDGPQLDDSQAGFRTLRYSFEARHSDDGALFQCKVTTSAIGSFERSCSLGPLRVNYRPRVALAPPPGPVALGDDIHLECAYEATPEPFQYRWTSSRPLLDGDVVNGRSNKVLVLVASARLNGTRISCNATNIVGSGVSNQVTIRVQKKGYMTTESSRTDKKYGSDKSNSAVPVGPEDPGPVSAPAPGLSSRLLLMIIGILSLMLIVLLLVLIFYTCRSYQSNGNHSIVYGAPSSICNGTNIDRAWDQSSVYFEPRDQITAGEAPTWLRTPRQPQWRRNVAVQVPFIEDPPYAEIEQDWDDKVYTLQI